MVNFCEWAINCGLCKTATVHALFAHKRMILWVCQERIERRPIILPTNIVFSAVERQGRNQIQKKTFSFPTGCGTANLLESLVISVMKLISVSASFPPGKKLIFPAKYKKKIESRTKLCPFYVHVWSDKVFPLCNTSTQALKRNTTFFSPRSYFSECHHVLCTAEQPQNRNCREISSTYWMNSWRLFLTWLKHISSRWCGNLFSHRFHNLQ